MSLAIYIDVDDTFVRSVGTKRIPIPAMIEHIRGLHAQGFILYCWSAGGADYARQSAQEFDLTHCFTAFLPKPNLIIDDQPISHWPRCQSLHPATLTDQSLAEHLGSPILIDQQIPSPKQ